MKKILSLALAGVFCLGLTACGEGEHEHKCSAWTATESGHERVCECGEKESGEHVFEGGVCKVCSSAEPKKEEPDNKEPDDESGDKTPDDTNPDDESDNNEPEDSTEPEAPRALTEEEWRAALAEENFDNFTLLKYFSNLETGDSNLRGIWEFDGNKCRNPLGNESELFYHQNDEVIVTYYKDKDEKWQLEESSSSSRNIFDERIIFADLIRDRYAEFLYDEENNVYVAENILINFSEIEVCDSLFLEFQNDRLAKFIIQVNDSKFEVHFTHYGTTVVELPEIE